MMNQDYPVSPPDNLPVPDADRHPITFAGLELAERLATLVESWAKDAMQDGLVAYAYASEIARKTLEWATPILRQQGADQELEACCEWLNYTYPSVNCAALRADRRPKPPSLKEQALALLGKKDAPVMLGTPEYRLSESEANTIRRALEALDD